MLVFHNFFDFSMFLKTLTEVNNARCLEVSISFHLKILIYSYNFVSIILTLRIYKLYFYYFFVPSMTCHRKMSPEKGLKILLIGFFFASKPFTLVDICPSSHMTECGNSFLIFSTFNEYVTFNCKIAGVRKIFMINFFQFKHQKKMPYKLKYKKLSCI